MGRKKKLQRFAEIETFRHVVQPVMEDITNQAFYLKGKWCSDFFNNSAPLILELGCGKGEYSVNLGKSFPDKNFLGVDIKGARMWRGAKTVQEEQLKNIGFLRTRIEFIDSLFAENEVSEIWITFPDPFLKERKYRRRLSSSAFLTRYRKIMQANGIIHLKTDSAELYTYTRALIQANKFELLQDSSDINKDFPNDPTLSIRTFYEQQFIERGKKITYLKFRINGDKEIIEPPDEENK